jgi:light-independent protochlorophyllide reductase subunit B
MLVGSSCTAELIQDDPGGLAQALNLPMPVVALELPAYQRKENWGAAETFYQLVRHLAGPATQPAGAGPRCNMLGPPRWVSATAMTSPKSRGCWRAWAWTSTSWRR